MKIFRCPKCRADFYVYDTDVLKLLAAAGVREHWNDLVQMIGLIALGLPLTQIENLVARKQETIWARLQKCRASIPLWKEVASTLKTRWKLRQDDIGRLKSFRPRAKGHDSPYHVAFVSTTTSDLLCDAILLKKREHVRRKVEQILERKVAYTGQGEFYFADIDARQIPWIKVIREASSDQLNGLEEFFSEIASHIRHANTEAREPDRSQTRASQTMSVASLAALCEGFYKKMPLPIFLQATKEIATFLKVSN